MREHRQHAVANFFLKTIHHRQHHNQGGYTQCDTAHGNERNKGDKAIAYVLGGASVGLPLSDDTIYTKTILSLESLEKIFEEFYKNQPFVIVTTSEINLKQVVQTNKCIISIEKKGDYVLITSIIDNLLKGASGQAIQNMNLMFGFDETEGIVLKSSGF